MTLCVVWSCCILAFDDVGIERGSTKDTTLQGMEIALAAVFVVEVGACVHHGVCG